MTPLESGVVGVMALDPGGHSGLAWGRVREEGAAKERITGRTLAGSATLGGSEVDQVLAVHQYLEGFRRACHRAGFPFFFVCEDFVLTKFTSSERPGLSPVRIAAMLHGYRLGLAHAYERAAFGPVAPIEVVYQRAVEAKGRVTDQRLKDVGLWVKGKEHERDAWRHWCLFVAKRAMGR